MLASRMTVTVAGLAVCGFLFGLGANRAEAQVYTSYNAYGSYSSYSYGPSVSYGCAPMVVAPAPVVVASPPVYYAPRPVYVAPRRCYRSAGFHWNRGCRPRSCRSYYPRPSCRRSFGFSVRY